MIAAQKSNALFPVLLAQFFSALADNAVLIIAIALVRTSGAANRTPLLQAAFVVPFILLAPFAGAIADAYPKGRVMLVTNLLKLCGACAMVLGLNPVIAYSVIGIGATVYSPAKYGILTQLVEHAHLVRANGMLEGSTIAAILLGALAGGWLADHSLQLAFSGVIAAYLVAAGANLLIPFAEPEKPLTSFSPAAMTANFFGALRTLFSDPNSRFSLLGTSLFWATGVTLRLVLFAWAPAILATTGNQTPADLMAVVSIGIVIGAAIAGAWITLGTTNRALLGGVLLGPIVLGLAGVHDIKTAAGCMALIGICGGVFVVPLNALLQETGHKSVGAGRALAVQNFSENITMLAFVGAYSVAESRGVPVVRAIEFFGVAVFVAILGIAFFRLRKTAASDMRVLGMEKE